MNKNLEQQFLTLKSFINQIEALLRNEEERIHQVVMPHPDMVRYLTNAEANLASCYYNLVVNIDQAKTIDSYQDVVKKRAEEIMKKQEKEYSVDVV